MQRCGIGSTFIFPPGSGSRREKFKNNQQQKCKEIGTGNNCNFITNFDENLDQLQGFFLLLSNFFCIFQLENSLKGTVIIF